LLLFSTMPQEKKIKTESDSKPTGIKVPSRLVQRRQRLNDLLYDIIVDWPRELPSIVTSYLIFSPILDRNWANRCLFIDEINEFLRIVVWEDYLLATKRDLTSAELTRNGRQVAVVHNLKSHPRSMYVDEERQSIVVTSIDNEAAVFRLDAGDRCNVSMQLCDYNPQQGPWLHYSSSDNQQVHFLNLITKEHHEISETCGTLHAAMLCDNKYCLVAYLGGYASVYDLSTGKKYDLQIPLDLTGCFDYQMVSDYVVVSCAPGLNPHPFVAVFRASDGSLGWIHKEESLELQSILSDEVVVTSSNEMSSIQCRDLRSGDVLSSLDLDSSSLNFLNVKGHYLIANGTKNVHYFSLFDLDYNL